MEKPAFDLEKVYDEQINPLMAKIIDICHEHKMPMVASFQFKSDGKSDHDLCSSALLDRDERPIAPELERIYSILQPKRAPMMMVTAMDKDGNITDMTAIVP
jgi:hypothetical protein